MRALERVSDAELNALVDGELLGERRHQVESWLADQPDAASRVESWRRQNDIIRAAFSRVVSEAIPADIVRALGAREAPLRPLPPAAESAIQAPLRHPGRVERGIAERRNKMVGFSALAFMAGGLATLAAAAAIGSISHGVAHAPVPVSAVQISSASQRFARRALEAQAGFSDVDDLRLDFANRDPAAIAAFVAGQIGTRVDLPADLLTRRPQGVRMTPGALGLLAFVVYDGPLEGRTGIMIGRTEAGDTPGVLMREAGGQAVAWFVSDGVGYGVTGALPRETLVRYAVGLRTRVGRPDRLPSTRISTP